MMGRTLRWSLIPAVLLVAAIACCGGGSNSPDGASDVEAVARPFTTVVLHVTGMMKSKSGAT